MLLLLGHEASQTALFSEVLAKDHLKDSVQVLSESTFEALLPRINRKTPIVIEKGATVGKHQDVLVQTIKERDMTIIMMDCDEGDFHLFGVAVSPSGKYVAVKNNSIGRRQDVLVVDDRKPSIEYGSITIEKPVELTKTAEQPPVEEPTSTVDSSAQPPPSATPADAQTAQMESLAQFLEEESEPSTEVSASVKASDATHYWEHKTHITFQNFSDYDPTHGTAPGWLNNDLRKGHIKAFCTFDVMLYATKTPRQKWIQVRLTDAIGMNSKMGANSGWAKGYFNRFSNVYLYPGNSNDPEHSSLPAGWSRPNVEPHTPNSSTTYTSTTGWSFGVSGGVDPQGPNANVTASYSQSNQESTTIKDFSVRNVSDAAMSGWNFYYTAVDGGKWEDHFTWNNAPKPIANLAKSTLHMNAEAVYEGPPDTNEKLSFSFKPDFQYAVLRGNWANIWIYYSNRYLGVNHTSIDMGVVKNPNPGNY